jgi:predicted RNase H-like nuclease (RuvC/YqgF family)
VIELTDEEYQAEQQERAQLEAEIAALEAENAALEADISSAIYEVESLEGCIDESKKNVVPKVNSSHKEVSYNEEQVKTVLGAIEEMSSRYFVFKTLSSASKSLTQATDEYNTQFSNFHQLRRITLGYVIGLDTNIISSETLRKSVEKEYLQNTEYWLAYAIMAVMLWKQ